MEWDGIRAYAANNNHRLIAQRFILLLLYEKNKKGTVFKWVVSAKIVNTIQQLEVFSPDQSASSSALLLLALLPW